MGDFQLKMSLVPGTGEEEFFGCVELRVTRQVAPGIGASDAGDPARTEDHLAGTLVAAATKCKVGDTRAKCKTKGDGSGGIGTGGDGTKSGGRGTKSGDGGSGGGGFGGGGSEGGETGSGGGGSEGGETGSGGGGWGG